MPNVKLYVKSIRSCLHFGKTVFGCYDFLIQIFFVNALQPMRCFMSKFMNYKTT